MSTTNASGDEILLALLEQQEDALRNDEELTLILRRQLDLADEILSFGITLPNGRDLHATLFPRDSVVTVVGLYTKAHLTFRFEDIAMKLTADQQAKLELIENPEQREMLLNAIRQGMEIPEYAWQPLPADLQMGEFFEQMSGILDEIAGESDVSVDDVNSAMENEFDFEQLALRAQKTATAVTHFLCDPIELDSPIESPGGCMRLFCWGYFNPMGPTACELTLEKVESTGSFLIVIHSAHPIFPSGTIYGCLPAELTSNPNEVLKCLRILFSRNVSDETRFLGGLPSYVDFPDESPLGTEQAKMMFGAGLAHTSEEEFCESCELMQRYWCKPWERASEERRRAFSDAVARRQQDRPENVIEMQQSSDKEVFDQWWTLVTNPEHVKAELREMPAAWVGAIAHQRGEFDSP